MEELIVLMGEGAASVREYFCKGCKQLRLWTRPGEVSVCGNCGAGASMLVVRLPGELTDAEVERLREGESCGS